MPALIFGALVLVLALWALNTITKVDPRIAARVTKIGGGLLSLGLAVFLGLRGEIGIAIPLGAFGLGLLGWVPFGPAGFSARTQKTGGQTSRVRSAHFEMELDHDTGAMRGRIIAGRNQGAELADLDIETLIAMLGEVDDESRALLVAYLDRRDPAWSEHAQANAAAGRRATAGGKMSEQEAYQILGLEPGASANEIARAHRTLMKKLHPDQGGSTYLAARINEAKEILLRRHR
ncbi:MAG TPA: DnaJ domain-containing protein [Pseudolabrys sp.]|nr:DnaJ domain-containing protein [Pseudolabrys sp.]